MGEKMSRAPVYYVLAQVRFNAFMALDQYVPAIQDRFRKAGYPDFEKTFMATVAFAPPSSPLVMPPPLQPQVRFIFLNETRTSGFVLDQSMLFYQTTEYETYDEFVPRL